MCFSATASFTAGIGLVVVGVVTTRRASRRTEFPFALIPFLFGAQQLIEGMLWLTFPDKAPLANSLLTYIYSAFSHVLWPLYIPIAVLLIEPVSWRRQALFGILIVGAAVGLYLLYFLVRLPIVAQVEEGHVNYISPHFYVNTALGLYVLATCVSLLFSSHRAARYFGIAAIVSFIAAYAFYATWLISVWCFFAAALSAIVLLHFTRRPLMPVAQ
jgi:hypothetical protein